jgi:hypothetical protein
MRAAMAAELEPDGDDEGAKGKVGNDESGKSESILMDGNPNQWADRTKSRMQFGYDAYAEVERWWNASGRGRIEALAGGGDCRADSDRRRPAEMMAAVKARL